MDAKVYNSIKAASASRGTARLCACEQHAAAGAHN